VKTGPTGGASARSSAPAARPSARVLSALAAAAVFRLGGVLVGTHAFVVLGNMLGVRWPGGGARTEDVDTAGDRRLAVAIPDLGADIPSVLASLEMGFLPVPGLSPKEPSTSFKVRGRALRVDLLTPAIGRPRGPVRIHRFGAAAEPMPHLDVLLADFQSAAVIDGGGILVNVPSPCALRAARAHGVALAPRSDADEEQ
jgi:hypothetical protein